MLSLGGGAVLRGVPSWVLSLGGGTVLGRGAVPRGFLGVPSLGGRAILVGEGRGSTGSVIMEKTL